MDYIGSKTKLNDWIFSIIKQDNLDNLVFLDACAGSGAVSKYAVGLNFKKIISNDLLSFPQHIVIGSTSLTPEEFTKAEKLVQSMNQASPLEGFFYQNYSENAGRLYFSNANAKKIDGIRLLINNIKNKNLKSYALYCLLEAMSSVSNTAGVQAAFLKKLKDRAQKNIEIKILPCLCLPDKVQTYQFDILKLLLDSQYRNSYQEHILYIDPPYNERQYAPNYHLYETLVRNDNPTLHGATGLRDWAKESKSSFCSKKECLNFLEKMIQATTAKKIYISYSSDGLLQIEDFKTLGYTNLYQKEYKRYKSDSKRENDRSDLFEYLFEIERRNK